MIDYLKELNGLVSLACAMVLAFVVLHPRIHEGLIVKIGLNLMIFSLLATGYFTLGDHQDTRDELWRAAFVLRLGLFTAVVGVLWNARPRKATPIGRRRGDWANVYREDHPEDRHA